MARFNESSSEQDPVLPPRNSEGKTGSHFESVDLAYSELDRKELERAQEIQKEHWIKSFWRPAMGWLYMVICFVDFVLFPVLAMLMPVLLKSLGIDEANYVPWKSLTLENGGLIHLSFGAILGVTAWTRGLEKLRGNNLP